MNGRGRGACTRRPSRILDAVLGALVAAVIVTVYTSPTGARP